MRCLLLLAPSRKPAPIPQLCDTDYNKEEGEEKTSPGHSWSNCYSDPWSCILIHNPMLGPQDRLSPPSYTAHYLDTCNRVTGCDAYKWTMPSWKDAVNLTLCISDHWGSLMKILKSARHGWQVSTSSQYLFLECFHKGRFDGCCLVFAQ